MTNLIRRSALVICMLAVAAQASAQVVLVSQSRSVSGYAEAYGFWGLEASDSDSLTAPDFGLFEEEISLEAVSPSAWSRVSATQDSEIQAGHFSIHGNSTATDIGANYDEFEPLNAIGYGSVHSDFEVLFEVSTPKPFSLIGTLATTYASIYGTVEGYHIASLQLDRNGGPYLSFDIDTNGEIAVNESGILEPGFYTLIVKASSLAESITGGRGYSSFDLDFFMESPVAVDEMSWGQVKTLFR